MSLIADWGLIEWSIALGFGIPIFVLTIAFFALACTMTAIDRKENSTW